MISCTILIWFFPVGVTSSMTGKSLNLLLGGLGICRAARRWNEGAMSGSKFTFSSFVASGCPESILCWIGQNENPFAWDAGANTGCSKIGNWQADKRYETCCCCKLKSNRGWQSHCRIWTRSFSITSKRTGGFSRCSTSSRHGWGLIFASKLWRHRFTCQ